jgi:uncharacterized protein
MINVIFKKSNDNIVSFKMSGHAESCKEGYDLVCSAVSAVSQTTLIGFMEVLQLEPLYSIDDGFLSVSLQNLNFEEMLECQTLIKTMYMGLKNMELSYGDYIKVKIEEV